LRTSHPRARSPKPRRIQTKVIFRQSDPERKCNERLGSHRRRNYAPLSEPADCLHPERESKAALDRIKAEIGSLMFSAQCQQRPVPLEGNLIRRDWFRFYDELPQAVPAGWIGQSWDIATMTGEANDFSVCTTWRMIRRDYYLADVFRDRLQYPDLRRKIAKYSEDG
jgi:hypothetical protein